MCVASYQLTDKQTVGEMQLRNEEATVVTFNHLSQNLQDAYIISFTYAGESVCVCVPTSTHLGLLILSLSPFWEDQFIFGGGQCKGRQEELVQLDGTVTQCRPPAHR